MTIVRMLVTLLVLTAAGGAYAADGASADDKRAPRAAYWCAALLDARVSVADEDRPLLEVHLARVAPKLRTVAAVAKRIARLRSDLARLPNAQFPVRHFIVGEDAIRAYLSDVRARANELDRRHPAAGAVERVPYEARQTRAQAGWLVWSSALTTMFGYGAFYAAHEHHGVWAGVLAALAAREIHRNVYAKAYGLTLTIREYFATRIDRRAFRARPARVAHWQSARADALVNALDDGTYRDGLIYDTFDVPLAMRVSDASNVTSTRAAPNAAQIVRATRTHGDAEPPFDPRRYVVDTIFRYDRVIGQPTLMVFGRESRYPQDLPY